MKAAAPGAFRLDALALLSGALAPFGFAPFGWWPLPILSVAVLIGLLSHSGPGRGLWRGWLFGLGLFGVGTSWVVESFQYNNVALPSALALTTLMVMVLALFPGLFGLLLARVGGLQRTPVLLALVPGAWVLTEWLRGTLLTGGVTFLQLGYTQVDAPLFALAPVVGVYGVSLVLAATAAVLVWIWADWRRRVFGGALVLLVPWVLTGLLDRAQWALDEGEPLDVAVVQGNIPQALKWRPEFRERTLEIYVGLTRQHWDADLVVWPETALPGLYATFLGFLAQLEDEARDTGTDLLIGVPSARAAGGGDLAYFNSVVSVGSERALYHKRHLVPFGEYVPLQGVFQPLIDLFGWPVSSFSHGTARQSTLEVAGHTVGLSICFEIAFGRDIITALPAAALLINVSNDAWFGGSIGPHQHFQMARWRAKETARYLVRATNTGISALVSPEGEVLAALPQFEQGTLSAKVQPLRGATPYVRTGDLPSLLVAAVLLLVSFVWARRD